MLTRSAVIMRRFTMSWMRCMTNRGKSLGIVGWKLWDVNISTLLGELLPHLLPLSYWCSLCYKLYILFCQKNRFEPYVWIILFGLLVVSLYCIVFFLWRWNTFILLMICLFVIAMNVVELSISINLYASPNLYTHTLSYIKMTAANTKGHLHQDSHRTKEEEVGE